MAVVASPYLSSNPRKRGQTTSPRMIFHHTRLANAMVKSHPANHIMPARGADPASLPAILGLLHSRILATGMGRTPRIKDEAEGST